MAIAGSLSVPRRRGVRGLLPPVGTAPRGASLEVPEPSGAFGAAAFGAAAFGVVEGLADTLALRVGRALAPDVGEDAAGLAPA